MKVTKKFDIIEVVIYLIIVIGILILIRPVVTIIRNKFERKATVTIKGEVIFPEYKQGKIFIAVWDTPSRKTRTILAKTTISQPGPYTLSVPKTVKEIYIVGFNDVNNNRKYERGEPVCYYGYPGRKKSIDITSGPVGKVDLRMYFLR